MTVETLEAIIPELSTEQREEAFLSMWQENAGDLLASALSHTGNDIHSAEDLLQTTALKAFESLDSFEPGTNDGGWLYTILHHSHIDNVRKRDRRPQTVAIEDEIADKLAYPAPNNTANEALDAIMADEFDKKIIAGLQRSWARVFLARYNGYTNPEMVTMFDMPLGTVQSSYFKAQKKLRTLISVGELKS